MNYNDCANMLYKQAAFAAPTTPQQSITDDPAKSGAIIGGGLMAGVGLKSMMGPKRQWNQNYVKGTPKTAPNYEQVGKRIKKNSLPKRVKTLGSNIVKKPGRIKTLGKMGLVGAGVGYVAGKAIQGVADASNELNSDRIASVSGLFEKIANSDNLATLMRDGATMAALNDIKKKREIREFLDDIDCEVCGYEGKPTNRGLCPDCGATLGIDESKNYRPAVMPYFPWDGSPANGMPFDEQAMFDEMSVQQL